MQDGLTRVIGNGARAAGWIDEEPSTVDLAVEVRDLKERLAVLELAVKSPPEGLHNAALYGDEQLFDKVIKGNSYRDQSVVMLMPSIRPIDPKVAFSWLSLMTPANNRVFRMSVQNCEVADAYNIAIRDVLANSELSNMSYVATVESDNILPPNGLLTLLVDIHENNLDGICAIYHTKGPGGVPNCYGRVGEIPHNYRPFAPPPNAVTRCNAIAMGFALFRLDLFRRVSYPWFKTVQHFTNSAQHESLLTQDIAFCIKAAREVGAKFGVSTNVKVGHLDTTTQVNW